MNPNMANTKLRGVFEELGFANVRTYISSGNVLFESDEHDVAALEKQIEETLPRKLGFTSQTIIRSKHDLDELVKQNPFPGMAHSRNTSLNVTFLKENKKVHLTLPPEGRGYTIVASLKGAVCFVVDLTTAKTPQIMNMLEKEFEKKVTTRTWNTVTKLQSLL